MTDVVAPPTSCCLLLPSAAVCLPSPGSPLPSGTTLTPQAWWQVSYLSLLSPIPPRAVALQAPLTASPSGWLSCLSQTPRPGIGPQMLSCKYLTLSLVINQNRGKLCVRVTTVHNLTPSGLSASVSGFFLLPLLHSGLFAP